MGGNGSSVGRREEEDGREGRKEVAATCACEGRAVMG
jgi:hypothetical protein